MSVILFSVLSGLSIYLLTDSNGANTKKEWDPDQKNNKANSELNIGKGIRAHSNGLKLFIIALYILSLTIAGTSKPVDATEEVFLPWNQLLTPTLIFHLFSAILLSFYLPGYCLVTLLRIHLEPLPITLLSVLLSMLFLGLVVYTSEIIIGIQSQFLNQIIIGMDLLVLLIFLYQIKNEIFIFDYKSLSSYFLATRNNLENALSLKNTSIFLIFASLFALVIFYTIYLEGGVIVGDQWFHHGKALLINSGEFKEIGTSYSDRIYPPFFSAFLAGFFTISGIPSINAYVSIHFLNMLAIFAFYYFFSRWVPARHRRIAVLATVLFVLSSGFGWAVMLDNLLTSNSQPSVELTLESLHSASIRSSDIRTPSTFINVGHPTFSSPLIIIGLPAGFVLLGLLKENLINQDKLRIACLMILIAVLGIISHYEFYLFILVGSILITSFRSKYGNLNYLSIILALFVCASIDYLSPLNYYTSIHIFGIPLLILSFVFVSVLWVLHISKILSKVSAKYLRHIFSYVRMDKSRPTFLLKLLLVSALAYTYVFSFIVLNYLSDDDIEIQVGTSTQRNIPWYLYPIKFGISGLIGLAFVTSYIFKRFEKEIFVFGIISLVALLAGPYYDEHRFSKYIMVGMVGFTSILIYKIILKLTGHENKTHRSYITTLRYIAPSILIGAVVTMSALSVFMLAGYKELGYKDPQFQEDFYRINFPSTSEMDLLKVFRNDLADLKTGFVVIGADDLQSDNLFSKLIGFSAIPGHKILQNPSFLNSSTLEGLYSSLDNQDTKFILFMKKDLDNEEKSSLPLNFVLNNFPRVYEDETYAVLKIPQLLPPSQGHVNIGLLHNKINELPPLSTILNDTKNRINHNNTVEQYNYQSIDTMENDSNFIKLEKNMNTSSGQSQIKTLTLYGDTKTRTLWLNPVSVDNKVNYIEAKLRLLAENKTRNDFGIKFQDSLNMKEYYVSIDKNSLDLEQKSIIENMNSKQRILSQDKKIIPSQWGMWHTLKILVLNDTLEIYLDDVPKIKISKSLTSNFNIVSKIGVTANNNIVQFEPIKIGHLSESTIKNHEIANLNETYFRNYFPLSALALSKLGYDVYVDGDYSVYANKYIILPADPKLQLEKDGNDLANDQSDLNEQQIPQDNFNMYLEYVKSGGTLIVMNSYVDNNEDINNNKSEGGAFAKFLSIHYCDKIPFNRIIGTAEDISVENHDQKQAEDWVLSKETRVSGPHFVNISGLATRIDFDNSTDISVRSYYENLAENNEGNIVAPFAIEKKYGKGKIVLVNAEGYFDSIYEAKRHAFGTLVQLPELIGLNSDNSQNRYSENITTSLPNILVNDFEILNSTNIIVKSNSFLLNGINNFSFPSNLSINNISVSSQMTIKIDSSNSTHHSQKQYFNETLRLGLNNFSNTQIKDLKFYGPYHVVINSTMGLVELAPTSSYYNYVSLSIPTGSDILLRLSDGAYVKFTVDSCSNNSHCERTITISGRGDILLHKITRNSKSITYLPIFVKSPELTILNGSSRFNLEIGSSNNSSQPVGRLLVKGNLTMGVAYVENYKLFDDAIKRDSIIHLSNLNVAGTYVHEEQVKNILRLPGELSERAKDKGIEVPLQTALISANSILTIISIAIIMIAVNYYLVPKINKNKQLYK